MAGGKHITENGNCDPNGRKTTTTTTTKKKTGKKGTGKTGKSRKKK